MSAQLDDSGVDNTVISNVWRATRFSFLRLSPWQRRNPLD